MLLKKQDTCKTQQWRPIIRYFCVVATCSVVVGYQCFRGPCCFHLYGATTQKTTYYKRQSTGNKIRHILWCKLTLLKTQKTHLPVYVMLLIQISQWGNKNSSIENFISWCIASRFFICINIWTTTLNMMAHWLPLLHILEVTSLILSLEAG
jgi:hypothetical protein